MCQKNANNSVLQDNAQPYSLFWSLTNGSVQMVVGENNEDDVQKQPSQNTNVYHMVVHCSQMFANIKHSITVLNEHLFDVCGDSSKCEKRLCLAGW